MPVYQNEKVKISTLYRFGFEIDTGNQTSDHFGTEFEDKYQQAQFISLLWLAGNDSEPVLFNFDQNWTSYEMKVQPTQEGLFISIKDKYNTEDPLLIEKHLNKQEVADVLAFQLYLLVK